MPAHQRLDNPSIIETYANKFLGTAFDGGAVTFTFGSLRVRLEKTDEGPIQGQQPELMNGLNAALTALRQQAQAQRVAPQSEHVIPQSSDP
jgi:hypothetical protein